MLGAGIEGEPFALAGGVLAHHGLVAPWAALAATFAGAAAVDQGWFLLARRARGNRWVRAVADRPGFARALDLLDRHPRAFVLLFRFAYGVRAVAPVAIGISRVAARLFVPLELLAAAVWAAAFIALGYVAGPWFGRLFARYGVGVEIAAILVSAAALAIVLRRGRHARTG